MCTVQETGRHACSEETDNLIDEFEVYIYLWENAIYRCRQEQEQALKINQHSRNQDVRDECVEEMCGRKWKVGIARGKFL